MGQYSIRKLYRVYFVKYMKEKKLYLIILFLLMLGNVWVQLIPPQILRDVIDGIFNNMESSAIVHKLLLFILLVFIGELVRICIVYIGNEISWSVCNKLRIDLIEHCLKQTDEVINSQKTGELIEVIEGDVSVLKNFFSSLSLLLIQSGLMILGTLLIIYSENSVLGIIESVFVIFVFGVFWNIHNVAVPKWRKERECESRFYGYITECVDVKEEIIANGYKNFVLKQIKDMLIEWFPNNVKANVISVVSYAAYIAIVAISYAIVFGGGTFFWIKGSITIGTIYLLYQYNQNLIKPIEKMRRQIEELQRVSTSLERISMLEKSNVENNEGQELEGYGIGIVLKNVYFEYKTGCLVLKNITFDLKKNRTLGIIGRTGSGKTTLVKLLMKVYETKQGDIFYNGVSINEVSFKSLRERTAYISQEVSIYDASLRDNITLFNSDIKDEVLLEIIKKIGLEEWYFGLENGLDTRINEYNLSIGQAQLVSLIRVFVKEVQLVILDEAYSDIDPLTEKYIHTVMEHLVNRCTCIIIAHRMRTIEMVDELILLENGCIIEKGSYSKLVKDKSSKLNDLIKQNEWRDAS